MRTCFSQIPDARSRWRSFDDWRRRSTYQGAAFPQASCWRRPARQLDPNDTGAFKSHFRLPWRSVGTSFATSTRGVPAAKRLYRSARGPRGNCATADFSYRPWIVPLVYVATAIPRFAAYSFHPVQAWLGLFVAIAALGMFHLTHRALGRNWSISLDVREESSTRDGRDLPESSAPDVFGILAVGCRSGIAAA